MLTLLEVQREMRDAILAAPSRALLDEVDSDRIPARRRLNVYRNHYRVSLKTGLADRFPATRTLLGERYFDAMADIFVVSRPPRDPRLCRYGRDFPRFLSGREELEGSLYAADVAQLEWTLCEILDAPEISPVELGAYQHAVDARGGAVRLHFSNSVVLFYSEWQVHEIRRLMLAGADAEAISPLVASPEALRLLLYRDGDGDPCELPLDEVGYSVLRLLRAGRSVTRACRAARIKDPNYPLGEFFEFLFQSGLVAGLSSVHAFHRDAVKEH